MTPTERLIGRLRTMSVPIPEGTQLRRTYAGRDQRSKGAWSWFFDYPDRSRWPDRTFRPIGSIYPVSLLLREPRLMVMRTITGDLEVDPWEQVKPWYRHDVLFEESPHA